MARKNIKIGDNVKEKYNKYKELKKNPRYNALFKLLFWFAFFGILYLIVISGVSQSKYVTTNDGESTKVTTNSVENYNNMKSYEYQYILNYNDGTDKNVIVDGTYFEENYYFKIGENNYYFSDSLYLVLRDTKQLLVDPKIDLPISLTEIDRFVIYNWINGAEKDSEVTYKDNSKVIEYVYSVDDSYKVYIEVYEKDYMIEKIDINLIDFLSTKNLQLNKFDIHIEYKNINNISSYEKNYDEYETIDESM
jgi:hypothetical protein